MVRYRTGHDTEIEVCYCVDIVVTGDTGVINDKFINVKTFPFQRGCPTTTVGSMSDATRKLVQCTMMTFRFYLKKWEPISMLQYDVIRSQI